MNTIHNDSAVDNLTIYMIAGIVAGTAVAVLSADIDWGLREILALLSLGVIALGTLVFAVSSTQGHQNTGTPVLAFLVSVALLTASLPLSEQGGGNPATEASASENSTSDYVWTAKEGNVDRNTPARRAASELDYELLTHAEESTHMTARDIRPDQFHKGVGEMEAEFKYVFAYALSGLTGGIEAAKEFRKKHPEPFHDHSSPTSGQRAWQPFWDEVYDGQIMRNERVYDVAEEHFQQLMRGILGSGLLDGADTPIIELQREVTDSGELPEELRKLEEAADRQ